MPARLEPPCRFGTASSSTSLGVAGRDGLARLRWCGDPRSASRATASSRRRTPADHCGVRGERHPTDIAPASSSFRARIDQHRSAPNCSARPMRAPGICEPRSHLRRFALLDHPASSRRRADRYRPPRRLSGARGGRPLREPNAGSRPFRLGATPIPTNRHNDKHPACTRTSAKRLVNQVFVTAWMNDLMRLHRLERERLRPRSSRARPPTFQLGADAAAAQPAQSRPRSRDAYNDFGTARRTADQRRVPRLRPNSSARCSIGCDSSALRQAGGILRRSQEHCDHTAKFGCPVHHAVHSGWICRRRLAATHAPRISSARAPCLLALDAALDHQPADLAGHLATCCSQIRRYPRMRSGRRAD